MVWYFSSVLWRAIALWWVPIEFNISIMSWLFTNRLGWGIVYRRFYFNTRVQGCLAPIPIVNLTEVRAFFLIKQSHCAFRFSCTLRIWSKSVLIYFIHLWCSCYLSNPADTAYYCLSLFAQGMQLNRKAAEERLSGNSGGMSFLARQRQASSRRSTPNRTQQTSAVSSRFVLWLWVFLVSVFLADCCPIHANCKRLYCCLQTCFKNILPITLAEPVLIIHWIENLFIKFDNDLGVFISGIRNTKHWKMSFWCFR